MLKPVQSLTGKSPLYAALAVEATSVNESNDCVPKAIAILSGLPYATVRAAFAEAGRKDRKGTSNEVRDAALKALGYKPVEVPGFCRKMIARYPAPHNTLKSLTSHQPVRFREAWAGTEDLYLQMPRHCAAFKDGRLHDWSEGRLKRIRAAMRLVKVEG